MDDTVRDRQVKSDAPAPAGGASAAGGGAPKGRLSTRARVLLVAIGLGAFAIGGVWGARWWLVGRFIQSTDDAYLQADSVTIAPKVSGYIVEVYVTDNQSIPAGAPLVRLDNRQYHAVLDQLTATTAARKADIARSEADLLLQRANIAQARAARGRRGQRELRARTDTALRAAGIFRRRNRRAARRASQRA